MSDFDDITLQAVEFDAIMNEADMARAYIQITSEMGPSPQLTAFVNYSGSIVSDDGVGLESMSLDDQHAIILSRLNPDALDSMGLENLKDRIHKIAQTMTDGSVPAATFLGLQVLSILSGPIGKAVFIGGVSLLALTAHDIVLRKLQTDDKTYSHEAFVSLTRNFDAVWKYEKEAATHFPTTFDLKTWKKYYDEVYGSKLRNIFLNAKKPASHTIIKTVDIGGSHWGPAQLAGAVQWIKVSGSEVDEAVKAYEEKIKAVKAWVDKADLSDPDQRKIAKFISDVVGLRFDIFRTSGDLLKQATKVVSDVASHFEEKKK